jgi:hypothetical protein
MKAKEGDVFACIKTLVMDDKSISFIKGCIYVSLYDNFITNEKNNDRHEFKKCSKFLKKHFIKLK